MHSPLQTQSCQDSLVREPMPIVAANTEDLAVIATKCQSARQTLADMSAEVQDSCEEDRRHEEDCENTQNEDYDVTVKRAKDWLRSRSLLVHQENPFSSGM